MSETVQLLNSFLRNENTAIETHRHAIDRLAGEPYIESLSENLVAHEARVVILRSEIIRHGGMPTEDAGLWGTFNRLLVSPSAIIHERAAIATLEDGEDMGRSAYKREYEVSVPPIRFVIRDLLARQTRSHEFMNRLLRASGRSVVTPSQSV